MVIMEQGVGSFDVISDTLNKISNGGFKRNEVACLSSIKQIIDFDVIAVANKEPNLLHQSFINWTVDKYDHGKIAYRINGDGLIDVVIKLPKGRVWMYTGCPYATTNTTDIVVGSSSYSFEIHIFNSQEYPTYHQYQYNNCLRNIVADIGLNKAVLETLIKQLRTLQ